MSERLNKLCELLNNENYENAIAAHKSSSEGIGNLDDSYQLKLAKAYFYVSADYRQTVQILQRLRDAKSIEVYYEARLLLVKASYLQGGSTQESIRLLQDLRGRVSNDLRDNPVFSKYHASVIKEVEEGIVGQPRGGQLNRSSAGEEERRQFQKLLGEQDDNSIIMEGMPKFLISSRWFQAWKDYTKIEKIQKQKKHPGPITQFELIDHRYRIFIDPTPSKEYTNRYIFNGPAYELLPKKCWEFLKQRYGGVDVKRFNISFIDKPYEIITEVYLKKIEIAKSEKDRPLSFLTVQITKKESWGGLKGKLAVNWGAGDIYEFDEKRNNIIVNDAEILEEVDTVGKRYLYIPQDKVSALNGKKQEKCGNKDCKQTEKLIFCKCKSIKYCGMDCLKADHRNHRKKCELQQAHLKQQSVIFKNFNLQEKDFGGMKGVVGLKNLGNTCYMNSGLQCLSNTKEMTEFFIKDEFKNHINYSNPLGTKGNLACTYAELIRQMWTGQSESVSPFKLKKIIGNVATQFSGFGQQDSQEFISYLIDGLSQDLNLVKKKEAFENGEEIKPDEEMSRQSELNYAKRIQSYIRNLMVGQFKSTVICSTCKKVSVCFDPYLLVSLPIPAYEEGELYFVPTDLSRGAIKFPTEYSSFSTLQKLTKALVSIYNKKLDKENSNKDRLFPERLLYVLIDGDKFKIIKFLQGNEKMSSLKGRFLLFCLQIPPLKDEEAFVTEFTLKDECISFPRIIKLPRKSSAAAKEALICEALSRGAQSAQSSYVDCVVNERVFDSKPFRRIQFTCRKKYKLLTYVDCVKQGFPQLSIEQGTLSLDDCLNSFAQVQSLVGENLWYCNRCKQHKQATRHLQLYKSNKILVIAFKRFNRLRKIRTPIKFPIENFNMGHYLLSNKSKQPVLYDLYGVVNHYGTMGGGHYTAYCQNFLDRKWYEFNDSRVSRIKEQQIVSGDSYVLFYRRKD